MWKIPMHLIYIILLFKDYISILFYNNKSQTFRYQNQIQLSKIYQMSEYQHVSISMHDLDELGFFAIMPKNDLDQNLHVIMSCVFVRVFSMFDVLKVFPCLFLPRTSSLSWLYIWFHNNIYRSVKSNFLHFSCQRMPLKVIEHSKTSHICIKLSFTFLLNLMFRRKRIYKTSFSNDFELKKI